jgi:FtsZ-interacting cell division protein ZipA
MSELRVALIVLGAVFLAALALWERRRSARSARVMPLPEPAPTPPASSVRPRRVEPSIEDFSASDDLPTSEELLVPTIHPVEPLHIDVAREAAVDVPMAATRAAHPHPPVTPAAIQWPPPRTERVLSLRMVSAGGEALAGRALRQALDAAGMVHGPQRIFHLVDDAGAVRASAANLVRPGSLEPAQMDAQEFRGLSVFCILPGPLPPGQMLDGLVQLARDVAGRVGAVVQDEQGAALDAERLAQLRRSVQGHAQARGSGAP